MRSESISLLSPRVSLSLSVSPALSIFLPLFLPEKLTWKADCERLAMLVLYSHNVSLFVAVVAAGWACFIVPRVEPAWGVAAGARFPEASLEAPKDTVLLFLLPSHPHARRTNIFRFCSLFRALARDRKMRLPSFPSSSPLLWNENEVKEVVGFLLHLPAPYQCRTRGYPLCSAPHSNSAVLTPFLLPPCLALMLRSGSLSQSQGKISGGLTPPFQLLPLSVTPSTADRRHHLVLLSLHHPQIRPTITPRHPRTQ